MVTITPGQAARAKYDELAMKRSKDLRWYTTEQLWEYAAADWEEIAQAAVAVASRSEEGSK